MKRFGLLVCLLFLLMPPASLGEEDTLRAAGVIKTVKGKALVLRNNAHLPAIEGNRLYENDTLWTGENGSMGVILKDDTVLSLGPESEIVIDEFIFEPESDELSIMTRMVRGTVSYISGKISKMSPESAQFETPVATIGIRGTSFLVKIVDEEDHLTTAEAMTPAAE
jgi:hypothetical protein